MFRSLSAHSFFVGVAILVTIVVSAPTYTHAASVMWTEMFPGKVETRVSGRGLAFSNPNVQVEYRAVIKNATTGQVIPPGGSVQVGTPLTLEFDPHVSTDISWFAVGSNYDSPFGDWSANAAPPPSIQCLEKDYVGIDLQGGIRGNVYASLSVDPPVKNITGTQGLVCGAPSSNGSLSCTAQTVGAVPALFSFLDTKGSFYGRFLVTDGSGVIKAGAQCVGSNAPMAIKKSKKQGQGEVIPVALRTIPYPIAIVERVGTAPNTPSITGSAQCTTGVPYAITMSASDPDGDRIRYLVDWGADGSVNEVTAYVPSGTAVTRTRVHSSAGSQAVRVLAEDAANNISAWSSTFAFSCAQRVQTIVITEVPVDDGSSSGTGSSGGNGGSTFQNSGTISIRARPSLLVSGETTHLHWSASNVLSCSITGTNNNGFGPFTSGATKTITNEPAGTETAAIYQQVAYTLSCQDIYGNTLNRTATVNIIPTWSDT